MSDHVFLLGRYVNMQIRDVRSNPKGVVIELGPMGRRSTRRILVEGITRVSEIPDRLAHDPAYDADWEQQEIDLGDEYADRKRYEEDPCES
jgi:hypothetical protein